MNSIVARKLMSELESIQDALRVENYPVVEERLGAYDTSLRACFAQPTPVLSIDECQKLQQMQAQVLDTMRQMRDEAAEWLRNNRQTRHAIQAYTGLRAIRRRGAI